MEALPEEPRGDPQLLGPLLDVHVPEVPGHERVTELLWEPGHGLEDAGEKQVIPVGVRVSLGRLEARPTATLSVEAQERHERRERVHRDD